MKPDHIERVAEGDELSAERDSKILEALGRETTASGLTADAIGWHHLPVVPKGLRWFELTEAFTYPDDKLKAPYSSSPKRLFLNPSTDHYVAVDVKDYRLYMPGAPQDDDSYYLGQPEYAEGTILGAVYNYQSDRWEVVTGPVDLHLVQIRPDTGERYATVNASGVFDGRIVTLDPSQGGDLREATLGAGKNIWILPLRHRPESMTEATYSSKSGAFTNGEHVTQEGTGASGWLFEDESGVLYIHTEEGSAPFATGGAADATITGETSGETAEMDVADPVNPASVTVPQTTLDEEKVTLLPGWDVYQGIHLGTLNVDDEERPLYAIDEAPDLRQFEVTEDMVQAGDETWPLYFDAVFSSQPDQPSVRIYRPSEWGNPNLSAYYPGIARKGGAGHHGSFGFAKWSRLHKRWEYAEGSFKIYGIGVADDDIPAGVRGTVSLWWKKLGVVWAGVEDSGANVEALNWYYEIIKEGTKVCLAYDRQENLWYIIDCQWPVMVEGTDGAAGFFEEIGKLIFDDVVNVTPGTHYFKVTQPNPGEVKVEIIGTPGITATFDPNTKTSMTFVNGLLTATVP